MHRSKVKLKIQMIFEFIQRVLDKERLYPNKHVQEVIFSPKIIETLHPRLTFNNNSVKQVQFFKTYLKK